jgi:hypothetical protein
METGQMFWLKRTGARFEVEEVSSDRAIARGMRTGARILVTETPSGYYGRTVQDNGQSGSSLFDSLIPSGPRFAMRDMRA